MTAQRHPPNFHLNKHPSLRQPATLWQLLRPSPVPLSLARRAMALRAPCVAPKDALLREKSCLYCLHNAFLGCVSTCTSSSSVSSCKTTRDRDMPEQQASRPNHSHSHVCGTAQPPDLLGHIHPLLPHVPCTKCRQWQFPAAICRWHQRYRIIRQVHAAGIHSPKIVVRK